MFFKKNKSLLFFLTFVILVFIFISLYYFVIQRKKFLDSGPSATPTLSLTAPAIAKKDQPLELTWEINTPTPRRITSTTIYYDLESTPSAVTASDSPLALGYAFSLPDYQSGDFESPGNFSATLIPPTMTRSFFLRAYALIDGDHYWTPEIRIILE